MKKKWCRHIKWRDYTNAWHFLKPDSGIGREEMTISRNWKLCPICYALRPGYWMNPKTGKIEKITPRPKPTKRKARK